AKVTASLPGWRPGCPIFFSLRSASICFTCVLPIVNRPVFVISYRVVSYHNEPTSKRMGDHAPGRRLRGYKAAFCSRRIFLHSTLSRHRRLSARGFERRGVAEQK